MQVLKRGKGTYKRRILLKILGLLITAAGLLVLGVALNTQPIHAIYVVLGVALLILGIACIATFDALLFALDFIINLIAS